MTSTTSAAPQADAAEQGAAQPRSATVLVINSGSSSLKFQLVAPETGEEFASGIVERVGTEAGTAKIAAGDAQADFAGPVGDHVVAMQVVQDLFDRVGLALADANIVAVGHRVVQGGAMFDEPVLIDDAVRGQIHALGALAPLHNYAAVHGIDGAKALLPDVPHVAVFDTAFFTALPEHTARYAINKEIADEHRIRRYGAHGTSHRYISEKVAQIWADQGKDPSTLRQIVLHLGNGASVSAVQGGRPIDTSMGLTPLEGLVMGTRSGDIDPSVYVHLYRQAELDPEKVDTILNKQSGMMGLCGMSDFRDIEDAVGAGQEAATLATDIYTHRLRKYLGSYTFAMGGVDVITFTAGIGENSGFLRERTLHGLEGLGFMLDAEANAQRSKEPRVISAPDSPVTIMVVPTNEELAIAQQALATARAA